MKKWKLILLLVIFGIAILLILLGFLFDKKDKNNGNKKEDTPKQETLVKENEEVKIEVSDMLPSLEDLLKTREELFKITPKNGTTDPKDGSKGGEESETLQHKTLNYELNFPKKDIQNLLVEEIEKNGIISTGFYYVTKDTKALVFSMNNYPIYEWDKYKGATNDVVLGNTPIRVMTYSVSYDIPFKAGTEDYKNFVTYLHQVPKYAKTFKFTGGEK